MGIIVRKSSLGWVTVVATERGVCLIEFGDQKASLKIDMSARFPEANWPEARRQSEDALFQKWTDKVLSRIDSPGLDLDIPLDIQGTVFQQQVWEALKSIPVGATATYSDVAEQIGRPRSVRAVASACGANKLAVLIPCHRVIRKDGTLGGYRWGLDRKRKLLDREKR